MKIEDIFEILVQRTRQNKQVWEKPKGNEDVLETFLVLDDLNYYPVKLIRIDKSRELYKLHAGNMFIESYWNPLKRFGDYMFAEDIFSW